MKKITLVFIISLILAIIFVLWGAFFPHNLGVISDTVQGYLQDHFSWFYLISATIMLLFVIFIAFSKYGDIKLGKDHEKPEYSTFSWFAMLFSAGMGIGLVFWGVAEPVSHFYNPPHGDGQTAGAAANAMRYSFFHWGLHPWGVYALIAMSLAYFKFRKDAPGTISATFQPLIGDRGVQGPIGKIIDIIAVFATVFGVATSLGLGAVQINGGISFLFQSVPTTFYVQFIIIICVTILFMASAVSGLGRGIKWLSNTNLAVAIVLMLFALIVGPTDFILSMFTASAGSYAENLPEMSFRLNPFSSSGTDWIHQWTIFYWSWWIAWSPFVGTFIARVSRGRTIREFIIGVLAAPTIFSMIWFAVFGGGGIHSEILGKAHIWNAMGQGDHEETALFEMFNHLPLGAVASFLAIILISTFFITSADSATFVLGMQTTNGMLNPPTVVKLIWGVIQAAAAAVLLYSGGLEALQTASIVSAFPFAIILLLMMFSITKALREEKPKSESKKRAS